MAQAAASDETLRGLPLWLVREYLLEMGATEGPEGQLRGDGWMVRLSEAEDVRIGSLRVGQIRLEIWGEPDLIGPFREQLGRRLMRGGA